MLHGLTEYSIFEGQINRTLDVTVTTRFVTGINELGCKISCAICEVNILRRTFLSYTTGLKWSYHK